MHSYENLMKSHLVCNFNENTSIKFLHELICHFMLYSYIGRSYKWVLIKVSNILLRQNSLAPLNYWINTLVNTIILTKYLPIGDHIFWDRYKHLCKQRKCKTFHIPKQIFWLFREKECENMQRHLTPLWAFKFIWTKFLNMTMKVIL